MNPSIDMLRREIERSSRRLKQRAQFMEVCGTHTASIFRAGIRSILPANIRLISGPGCPVCVTAQRHIDAALELAARSDVVLATYGDMVRVPGSRGSLERLRADGASIVVVNSALAALRLARERPQRSVVFLGVGFETTAPATAATILEAKRSGVKNFSVMSTHKLIVPAMLALLRGGNVQLDGFLCPGHVSVIIGAGAYSPLVTDYRLPCVVAGFEPEQVLRAVARLVAQRVQGQAALENVYSNVVKYEGNPVALAMLNRVFQVQDTHWRALGLIAGSGLRPARAFAEFDAFERFGVEVGEDVDHPSCRCGEVIQGRTDPVECSLFGTECTPLNPIGPCMVSSEGTCSAWYKYHRQGSTESG